MLSAVATGIGGLGLFFAGMFLLAENLKKLTGRGFRETVAAWTRNPAAGLAWGFAAGAALQSTSAITFVVVSMLASGLLTVRSALPIIIGCNVGTTLLVIIAALDIHLFVLAMLGLAGISFASERLAPWRTFALAVFGIGLVFLGLYMLQEAAAPVAKEPWAEQAMAWAGASYLLMFAIAALLSILTQSSNSTALLAITLSGAGVLPFEQAIMAVYGANVGASVLTYFLSAGLRGRQRQVAMYQVAFNYVAGLVMVPLFYVEIYGSVPIVRPLIAVMTSDPSLQLAFVHLVFNVAGAFVLIPLIGPAANLLSRRYPPAAEEDDAQPRYIYEQAANEPETALDLAALEQGRLAAAMPKLLEPARDATRHPADAIARRQRASQTLAGTLTAFLSRLGETQISHAGYERLNQTLAVQRLIEALNDTVAELGRAAREATENPHTRQLAHNIVEGLDALILTLVEAMRPGGEDEHALLRHLTGDRSSLMRRLREEYLASDATLGAAEKMTVLTLTNLAERTTWLLGRLAEILPAPPARAAVDGEATP